MKTLITIYLWAQIIFAVCVIIFGASYSIRCIVQHSGGVYVFLFGCIAFVGYKFLFRSSVAELREHRADHQNETK